MLKHRRPYLITSLVSDGNGRWSDMYLENGLDDFGGEILVAGDVDRGYSVDKALRRNGMQAVDGQWVTHTKGGVRKEGNCWVMTCPNHPGKGTPFPFRIRKLAAVLESQLQQGTTEIELHELQRVYSLYRSTIR